MIREIARNLMSGIVDERQKGGQTPISATLTWRYDTNRELFDEARIYIITLEDWKTELFVACDDKETFVEFHTTKGILRLPGTPRDCWAGREFCSVFGQHAQAARVQLDLAEANGIQNRAEVTLAVSYQGAPTVEDCRALFYALDSRARELHAHLERAIGQEASPQAIAGMALGLSRVFDGDLKAIGWEAVAPFYPYTSSEGLCTLEGLLSDTWKRTKPAWRAA